MEYEPDCIELESWVYYNHREFYNAVHYLNPSAQYEAHLKLWAISGKPEILLIPIQ